MNHALITGGAGFIGSQLAETLLAQGLRVTVIDDESTGARENLRGVEDHFEFQFVSGDCSNAQLLRPLIKDADQVYHLAAAVGVKLIADKPIDSIQRNIRPVEVLLEMLREEADHGHEIPLFIASSSEVYGKNPEGKWDENANLVFGPTTRSRWSYGAAKAIDEFLALAYWREFRLPVVIGRFFNVVGPRQIGEYGMVLPRFVDAALSGKSLVVHDDGKQVRCFAHVADVCRCVVELIETESARGEVFNIGGDEPISINELAQRVIATVDPSLSVEFQSYRDAYDDDFEDVRRRVPDLSKLHNAIRFKPEYSLDDTIREIVESRRGE